MKDFNKKAILIAFLAVVYIAVNILNKQGGAQPTTTISDSQVSVLQQAEEVALEVNDFQYRFKNEDTWESHFEKHGSEFGYATKEEYLAGANRVIEDPNSLCKTEAEDGDFVYYLESDNEIVFVSEKGIIRTYFRPDRGIAYYNSQ